MGPKRDYSFYDHRHQENHPVTKNFPINQSRYQPANPSLPGNLGSPEKNAHFKQKCTLAHGCLQ